MTATSAAAATTSAISATALVLNVGSSSVKFALYPVVSPGAALLCGEVSGVGDQAKLEIEHAPVRELPAVHTLEQAIQQAAQTVRQRLSHDANRPPPEVIGHRIVHGGDAYRDSVAIDDAVLARLETLVRLAPLHQPFGLSGVAQLRAMYPDALHVACFDTGFHATLGAEERCYALPSEQAARGLHRYGFHGLSYRSVLRILHQTEPELARARLVIAHLGNGSSLCAVREGHSLATTMGMTALEGVPMATRSGSLDPGLVLQLVRDAGGDVDAVERLLHHDCGLLALSRESGDVRTLRASIQPQAAFALDYLAYQVAKAAAALSVPLGGLDAIVFTGGIGANDAGMREAVCRHLRHLGSLRTLAVPCDEASVIAADAIALLHAQRSASPAPPPSRSPS